ncbi:MAG: AMP-binding protein [Ardenticatenaceae bacterium]|nr:AMP-binding protein [Ardenticatenaceae bacterium]
MNFNLNEVIQHFYDNAPNFKARMDEAGLTPQDITDEADLAGLPVLRKDDLIKMQQENPPFGGLLAVPMTEVAAVFQSPGPLYEPVGKNRGRSGWSTAMRAAGFKEGDIVMNALGYHMTPAGLAAHDAISGVGAVVFPAGIGNQDQQIEAMIDLNITGYMGLPSYLKMLIDRAEAQGTSLKVKNALMLAEPLPESLRSWFKSKGVEVFNAYGTAECGALGYECEYRSGWHIPENVLVQICDIETGKPLPHGETGEVVATVLSKTYATVRLGTGDLSSIIDEPCPCGRTSLRLNGWQGRIGMATKVRGMFLHPVQLGAMMARFAEIDRYQAVITRENHRDDITLQIVPKSDTAINGLAKKIEAAARSAIKFKLNVEIISADGLPEGSPPIRDERDWE